MKRLAACLLAGLLLLAGIIPAGAKKYTGDALDRAAILEFDPEVEVDEKDLEAYELANYYEIQYELETDTGDLRIFPGEAGPQAMLRYARHTWLPWSSRHPDQHESVRKAVLEEGVLSLGRYTFFECPALEEIWLPRSLRRIDQIAIYGCGAIQTIYYPGTEEDFYANVGYDPFGNYFIDAAGNQVPMADYFHFGEHVAVECLNQEGELFQSYIVGGYFVGDAYEITPDEFEGMRYTGKEPSVSGTYRAGEDRVITFTYECTHEYSEPDPAHPCDSACVHCGHHNPDVTGHTWASATRRTLFRSVSETRTCIVCGQTQYVHQLAYVWYIAAGLGALAILCGIALLVAIPLRRKKREKDMTW